MASIVVPTVLASTPEQYGQMLERARGLTDRVHIDICDGQFADSQTITLGQVQPADDYKLDLHLMVKQPLEYIDTAISLKPNLIIIHAEAAADDGVEATLTHCRTLGIRAGVALLPATLPETAAGLIRLADHVLIFTGLLGHNGGQFDPEQLAKVEDVRRLNPTSEISVDGGVGVENASLIQLQGVNVLYVGGAIQDAEDPQKAFDSITYQASGTEL